MGNITAIATIEDVMSDGEEDMVNECRRLVCSITIAELENVRMGIGAITTPVKTFKLFFERWSGSVRHWMLVSDHACLLALF